MYDSDHPSSSSDENEPEQNMASTEEPFFLATDFPTKDEIMEVMNPLNPKFTGSHGQLDAALSLVFKPLILPVMRLFGRNQPQNGNRNYR